MNETKNALDQLLAKIITNLSSSKVWFTLLGMVLSAYMGYVVGGKEGLIMALAGALGLPLTYTVSKTYQNTHGANAAPVTNGASPPSPSVAGKPPPTVPEPAASAPATPGPVANGQKYWEVPDTDQMFKNLTLANTDPSGAVNWFHVAQTVDGWYNTRKLTNYHPDARLPVARRYSDMAIKAHRQLFQVVCKIPAPQDYTLEGTESQNAVEALVKKASPGCEALGEAQKFEIVNLGQLYDQRRNLELLVGKSINWDSGFDTTYLLGHYGIMAIG